MYVSLLFAVSGCHCRLYRPPAFYNPSCGGATCATHSRRWEHDALTRGRDIQAFPGRTAVVALASFPFLKLYYVTFVWTCFMLSPAGRATPFRNVQTAECMLHRVSLA